MSGFATLQGDPIVDGTVTLPYSGIWHATLQLDRVPVWSSGPLTLQLADATYVCSPVRFFDFSGARQVLVVGGQGGWRKQVPSKQYANGALTVLVTADVAAEVGEVPPVIGPTVPASLGMNWVRSAGLASDVLNQIFGSAWFMDASGIVQTMARPPVPIVSQFTVIQVQGAQGIYSVATDSPADWIPGKAFVGPTASGIINRVMHTIAKGSFRTEVVVP